MTEHYLADLTRQRDKAREELAEARSWARHGYEIGQRHCGWTDHGVAPAWLTEGWPPHIDTCGHLTELGAVPGEIAYRIRAELVCCELYGRVNDTGELTFKQALASRDWHDLCYWGEAAARLAQGRADGHNSQSAPTSSQIRSCPDPALVAAEEALTRVMRLAETLPPGVRAQINAAIDGNAEQPAATPRRGCPACLWPDHPGQTCAENLTALQAADTHDCAIWEDEDGQWNVSCRSRSCSESSLDIGSEHDAEEWAERHQAAALAANGPS